MLSAEDILATMPDGMALVDAKLTVVEGKPAMEALVGRSSSRLVGHPLKDLFPQDERLPALVERCLTTGRVANDFERPLARPEQSPAAVWVTATPVLDTAGFDALLSQLLTLARPTTLSLERVNNHQLLDDVLTLHRESAAGSEVSFEQRYDPSLPLLKADPAQLTQVVLNLVKNALEVSPPGGTVTITTRMATEFGLPASGPGGRVIPVVCFEVADMGPGIPPSVQARLFTPFFTTKPDGSGLGLSVANGIVERHGGRLELANAPEGGVVARCYLPVEPPTQMREMP